MNIILADPNTVCKLFKNDNFIELLFSQNTYKIWTCKLLLHVLNPHQATILSKHAGNGRLRFIELSNFKSNNSRFKALDACECNTIAFSIDNDDFIVLSDEGVILKICDSHNVPTIRVAELVF